MHKWWRREADPQDDQVVSDQYPVRAHRRLGWKFWALLASALIMLAGIACAAWYVWALQPREVEAAEHYQRVIIESGDTATGIAKKLEDADIIRSALAMRIYTEISGTRTELKTGGYLISSSESVPEIVKHLVSGKSDEYEVTILSGQTLEELAEKLRRSGYDKADIQTALNYDYTHPVLEGRPKNATLEGYIYPETYRVTASSSLKDLFQRSFDELYADIEANQLAAKFKKQGLSLYQAMTLASIIQEEVSDPQEQKLVAQVFFKRLKQGMPLGSDPTFKYAAQKLGVEPRINIDSPYNTRIKTGLPPGPIANMELSALLAVASPAKTNYLYFVSGDDGTTYFSKTLEEHEAKTAKYCTELCQ